MANGQLIEFLWVFQNKNNLAEYADDDYQGNQILNFRSHIKMKTKPIIETTNEQEGKT